MARPPGVDDEYADLQKRFQMLENDRKSLFEHTQLEVKKNKEALAKLKKENKDLRSSLSSLMSDQGKNSGKDSEITKLEQQVSELRRRHDDVKHQCNFRQKELDSMQVRMWGEREGRGMGGPAPQHTISPLPRSLSHGEVIHTTKALACPRTLLCLSGIPLADHGIPRLPVESTLPIPCKPNVMLMGAGCWGGKCQGGTRGGRRGR